MGSIPIAEAVAAFVSKSAGSISQVTPIGPPGDTGLAKVPDYPSSAHDSWFTVGFAKRPYSMWRGRPLGHELVLTLTKESDPTDVLTSVREAVVEDERRERTRDRRRSIAVHGVWAPGYPPHLLFVPALPAELQRRVKIGDQYVNFLTVIPIDDRELRGYDRSAPGLIESLPFEIATRYPRPVI